MWLRELYEFTVIEKSATNSNAKDDIKTSLNVGDGHIWISSHFRDRLKSRIDNIDKNDVIDAINSSVEQYKDEWVTLPPEKFIIQTKMGTRLAIQKMHMADEIRYRMTTIHPTLYTDISQHVYKV